MINSYCNNFRGDFMEKSTEFIIITDAHYYSKKLGTDSASYREFNAKSQKLVALSSDVIKASFEKIKNDECKNVIFCGDSTCDGDCDSHREFVALLRELKQSGKNIFAITSTHDYQDNKITYKYTGDKKEEIPAESREELKEMYREFGIDNAVSVFEMSFAADIDGEIRLLGLNSDRNGKGRSGFSDEHLEWIKRNILEAKNEGKEVIAFTHHPLVSPSPFYALIGKNDMMGEHKEIREILADCGVELVFTGHSHIHDISYIFSENKNVLYDISTSALAGYPAYLRRLAVSETGYEIITEKAYDAEKYPDFDSVIENQFFGMIKTTIKAAKTDVPLLAECLNSMSVPRKFTYRFGWLIKPVAKLIDKITFGTVYRWTKKENGLKKEEISAIKDKKAVDFIIDLVMHLYSGNAPYNPDTPEYKIAKALLNVIDSVLNAFHLPLSKFLKDFDSVSSLIEPLLYNSGIDDSDAVLPKNPTEKDVEKLCGQKVTDIRKSRKGKFIAAVIVIALIILIPLLPVIALLLGAGFLANRIKYSDELSE